jgi:ADP-ribosylglycohydrolase
MRAAVLGAALCESEKDRVRLVEACSRVTHTDPLAIQGAQIIALAAALSARQQKRDFKREVKAVCPDWPWETRWPDRGPTGWIVHSVNAVIDVWQNHDEDPRLSIEAAVALGGDTDSVGAMLGGILGADPTTIWPEEWRRFAGWPNERDIQDLPVRVSYPRLAVNHVCLLPIVVAYGFRRLLPPY